MVDFLKEIEIKPWSSDYEVVHEDWLFKLLHFKSKRKYRIPLLVVYAFINRPYILDLHSDVSVVKRFLDAGLDVWMIDWGYPKRADRFLRISDYVNYIDFCVDLIRDERGVETVTLHGYCLGATLSCIYASIYPKKVKNLVLQALPLNFDTDNTLAIWAKNVDPKKISRTLGNVYGDLLNIAFLLVDPARLILEKYQSLLKNSNDERFVKDFMYMDHWIFDSPSIPGCVYEEYIERWYQKNEILRGEYDVNGIRVNLDNIEMPVLILLAEKDHITPPEAAIPFYNLIPSRDKLILSVDKGHIGLTVSRRAHKTLWNRAISWILERSD